MPSEEGSTAHSTTTSTILQLVVFITVILMTVAGNMLVCIAVFVFRHLRSSTNLVLVSLAVTDLSMVLIMVLNAITLISDRWIFGITGCHAIASIGLTLSFISILHLCLLSIDRYIAIFKPLRYQSIVRKRRITVILLLLWLTPAIVLNLPLADYEFRGDVYNCLEKDSERTGRSSVYIFIMVVLFVIVPFAIIFTTNAKVFKVALRHAKKLSQLEKSFRERVAHQVDPPEEHQRNIRQGNAAEWRAIRREIRTAKTFAVVVGAFVICYVPFFVAGTYRKYAGREAVPNAVIIVTTWVGFSNSFCNPVVYGLRHAPFRVAFKKLCSCARNMNYGTRNTNQNIQIHTQSSNGAYDTKL